MITKIVFAADHAGLELKEELIGYVRELGYVLEDVGAYSFKEDDDYPDFISNAAKYVASDPEKIRAIILGGSGQGEAIVANRFKNVRAVVYNTDNLEIIKLSREHNNANVLSIGARFVELDKVKDAVKLWLETDFTEEERHKRRIEKIEEYPN